MDLFIEVAGEAPLRQFQPDFMALAKIETPRGIIVTALAETPPADFISRFFAPRAGIPEDPVTGSAHCALAPYWADKLHKPELLGYQASRRGGWVRAIPAGDRVRLLGQAVTVLVSQLQV